MSLDRKTAKIFAHDAGAANVTFSYAIELKRKGYKVKAYPKGPAVEIYRLNIPGMIDNNRPQFSRKDLIVTGLSGVCSKYEIEMIKKAKKAGVRKVISIMDVSYNLDDRFILNGKIAGNDYLPDEIWLSEITELSRSQRINRLLKKKKNPYYERIKEELYSKPPLITNPLIRVYKNNYVLYLTEYIKEQYGNSFGYTEFSLLEDFLDVAKATKFNNPILIKLHPQERKSKYDKIINRYPSLNINKIEASLPQFIYYSMAVFSSMTSVFNESVLINKPSFSLQFNAKKEYRYLPKKVKVLKKKQELIEVLNSI